MSDIIGITMGDPDVTSRTARLHHSKRRVRSTSNQSLRANRKRRGAEQSTPGKKLPR